MNRMFFRKAAFVVALALAGLLGHAERSAAAEIEALLDLSLEELLAIEITTATKKPERIEDIVANVTIITRDDIRRMGYDTFRELLINIPGFYHIDNIADFIIGVRGTLGGSMAFLVNGIPQQHLRIKGATFSEESRFNIPIEAIDRVEVIRGPMAVTYGSNALLGVINVITNLETPQPAGSVSVSAGSNDAYRGYAGARKSFADGFVSLNAGYYEADGLEGRYSDMTSKPLDPRMDDKMDGRMNHADQYFDFSGRYREVTADFRYSLINQGFYALTPSFDEGNEADLESLHAALGHTLKFSPTQQLKTSLIYSREHQDIYQFDFIAPALYGDQLQEAERLEAEVRYLYAPNDKVGLMAGYRYQKVFNISNLADVPGLVYGDENTDDIVSHDLFLQGDYAVTDNLTLVAGARLSFVDSYDCHRRRGLSAAGSSPRPDIELDSDHYFTPSVGATYAFNDNHRLKLLYGEANQDNKNARFEEPEMIKSAELIYTYAQDDLLVSLGGFFNKIENLARTLQRYDASSGRYLIVADDTGEVENYGIEFNLDWRPSSASRLELGATWQDARDPNEPDIDVAYSPHWVAHAKASYQPGNTTYGVYGTYVGSMKASWQWNPGSLGGARIGKDVDDYFLVGLNVRHEFPGSGIFANLHVSNLFDEEFRYPANEVINLERGNFGPGREMLLTVGVAF